MARVKGVTRVLAAFKKHKQSVSKGARRGIKKSSAFIRAESQKIVPVEFGVLRASGFVRIEEDGLNTRGIIGYTASYALVVHEDLTKAHGEAYNRKYAAEIAAGTKTSRGPNQQAKYLETPFRQHKQTVLGTIRNEIKKETRRK